MCLSITDAFLHRFESFVLLPGEKKVEIEQDTRKYTFALGARLNEWMNLMSRLHCP